MSSFSPKTYQIYQYDDTNLSQISYYYNCFTLLEKPKERNVYKVSLAQMLHYMFDFGIGYNSKCVTTVTTQQQFLVGKYVNRHATNSDKRPATVADLKKKILDVVEAMVKRSVRHRGQTITKTNTIFPKYLFTLDTSLTTSKLKRITGHTYVEMSDFENFAYASNDSSYDMPKYQNGYVPIANVRCVPEHVHGVNDSIQKTISYKWGGSLTPQGNSAWTGGAQGWHIFNIQCDRFHHHHCDTIGKVRSIIVTSSDECHATMTPSWDKPSGVSCFENAEKDPDNAKNTEAGKQLSIRYYGRRYKLFKRQD
jgi:hypothetical protein